MTNTLMTFPCDFRLKVFGAATLEFEQAVLAIVREHVPTLSDRAVTTTPSKGNQYTAMSIQFEAESREQLDAIYTALSQHPLVKMAL